MQDSGTAFTNELFEAVRRLEIRPRERRWASVTYCLLDAVWSIGIHYDTHVVPSVRRVAALAGDERPLVPAGEPVLSDPLPLSTFRRTFPEEAALRDVTSQHLTSTTSGIRKSEAAIRYADVLLEDGIDTLADARNALVDIERVEKLTTALHGIPGDGVRTGYFWMLVGDDELVKPDRMILRFLKEHGVDTDVQGAKAVLSALARRLSTDERNVTPWMVDHAIWDAQRSR